jgi:putative methyltransferase (TIGR04325 family)
MTFHIWEGVYKEFKDVPAGDEVFDGERWLKSQTDAVAEAVARLDTGGTVSPVVGYGESLLPLLAALIRAGSAKVSILDLGGGVGLTYVEVIGALVDRGGVEYHIVEREGVCKAGRGIFKDDARIRFHSSLPEEVKPDVVHIGSALQYIEDWRGLLWKLASYRPGYILFTQLPAGDIETFATAQNYYGSKIPCWMFNIKEIIGALKEEGFDLSFKASFRGRHLGKEQEQLRENFPPGRRLERNCNLLFTRRAVGGDPDRAREGGPPDGS